jgi:hypothetical protein
MVFSHGIVLKLSAEGEKNGSNNCKENCQNPDQFGCKQNISPVGFEPLQA